MLRSNTKSMALSAVHVSGAGALGRSMGAVGVSLDKEQNAHKRPASGGRARYWSLNATVDA